MAYNNLNDLLNAINNQVQQSLKESVAPVVVEKLQEHVQKDVYDAYTPPPPPQGYERTGALKKDIQVEVIPDGISITDERYDEEDMSKYIVPIIESGQGYTWNTKIAGTPRPFVENTYDELQQTGLHIETLKQALKSKGIDVK